MEVPIDPTELLLGGALKMATNITAKGVYMIFEKGKAFLIGVAEELIPVSKKDAFDFIKYLKNKTESWTKDIGEFLQETFSPNGRTNEGFDMPQPQGGMKNEMVAKDTLRRGEVAEYRIERADILARMEPLDQNMSALRKKLDEIPDIDSDEAQLLKNQAVILAKKVLESSDRLVQRFIGFQEEIEKGKYPPDGIKEIVEGFQKTGQKLEEIRNILERDTMNGQKRIQNFFNKIEESYTKQRDDFYDIYKNI